MFWPFKFKFDLWYKCDILIIIKEKNIFYYIFEVKNLIKFSLKFDRIEIE